MQYKSGNRRLIFNTAALFLRMFVIMVFGFWISRIAMDLLGLEDYGIFNVVTGIVLMLNFFLSSLVNASQRFFSVEIPRNDKNKLGELVQIQIISFFVFGLLSFVAIELIGYYLLNNVLSIPENRLTSALIAMHLSAFMYLIQMVGVPFNALLIAYERMTWYAVVGFIEISIKIILVSCLHFVDTDKMIYYGMALLLSSLSAQVFYLYFARKLIDISWFEFKFGKSQFKKLFSFIAWNSVGSMIWAFNQQGVNFLINVFFGPLANSAQAVGWQIANAITQFGSNVTTAFKPQIIMSYAENDLQRMGRLMFAGSKYAFFLLLFITVPVFISAPYLLDLWLVEVPPYSGHIVMCLLVFCQIDILVNPLFVAIQATGEIRNYILVGGAVFLLNFPVSFLLLKLGLPLISLFISLSVFRFLYLFTAILFIANRFKIPFKSFINYQLMPAFFVISFIFVASFLLLNYNTVTFQDLFFKSVMAFIFVALAIVLVGLDKEEKNYLFTIIKSLNVRFVK